jgi:DNA-binding MarR family transcriptional regulator
MAASRPSAGAADPAGEDEEMALAPALRSVVGYLLRRTHNLFQTHWLLSFKRSDTPITPVQAGMLLVIEGSPGLTQVALARIMNVEGPTLLQSIDRLEEHGYVRRVRRLMDRRSYALEITESGREVLAVAQAFFAHRDAELMADLSLDERAQLAGLLTRILVGAGARLKALEQGAAKEAAAEIAAAQDEAPKPLRGPKRRPRPSA